MHACHLQGWHGACACPAGIRVNTISPGSVHTPMSGRTEEETNAWAAEAQVVGRAGKPAEIASLAVWMLSDEASFVTGANFAVDGGWQYKL
jgi:NAD(P)-dependent dehydrogenase (short-subunit alcohol dehydrogenase family)